MPENPRKPQANILVARETKFFFWPRLPRKSGLGINMAKKAGLLQPRWPGLPGFTRLHFPGKLGQKPRKPGLARLFQAGRVFDQAPDARAVAHLNHCT